MSGALVALAPLSATASSGTPGHPNPPLGCPGNHHPDKESSDYHR